MSPIVDETQRTSPQHPDPYEVDRMASRIVGISPVDACEACGGSLGVGTHRIPAAQGGVVCRAPYVPLPVKQPLRDRARPKTGLERERERLRREHPKIWSDP